MMARRCTRSALAGAALALFIALAGWLLPEAPPAAATGVFEAFSVVITSDAGPDDTYGLGDTITLRVDFGNHCVTGHTGGALAVTIGSRNRSATPTILTTSSDVDFSYTVVGGDLDTDGITVAANALSGTWNTSNHALCVLGAHDHPSPSITGALTTPQASHKVNAPATDYDTDDDNRIDVTTLAQLNAIRHDLDGNGDPASGGTAAYNTAFPNREDRATGRMGCPATCAGYELLNDLDFDTDGDDVADGAYANWTPIGTYTSTFNGNGHTISNLNVTAAGSHVGLFSRVTGGNISRVGLSNASVTASATGVRLGALVGELAASSGSGGTVTSCWSSGSVIATTTAGTRIILGGLVGNAPSGAVRASYSAASVSASATPVVYAGGLVGHLDGAKVTASYATGAVSAGTSFTSFVGGLVGRANGSASVITASYATGRVSSGSGATVGGLAGFFHNSASQSNSYWDTGTSGSSSGPGTGKTTTELQMPTDYTGIYENWNVDVDGDGSNDYPWYFGSASQYPTLQYGLNNAAIHRLKYPHAVDKDYDEDDDNLIDITTLDNLNGIRYDPDGDGAAHISNALAYGEAFPGLMTGMGCPATCAGYELLNDLDFDTDGDDTADVPYANWTPIGTGAAPFTATFDGNGHTIANLNINASGIADVGLLGRVSGGTIAGVGLNGINIAASHTSSTPLTYLRAGGLSGYITGSTVRGSYATGEITTTAGGTVLSQVGGLAGHVTTSSSIAASYAAVAVTANSTSPAATDLTSADTVGGLVGVLAGAASTRSSMTAAYATGAVAANRGGARVGGLIGAALQADVTASYATGTVTGATGGETGGLIGSIETGATVTASYWDTTTSGIPDDGDDDPPEGKNTRELKSPTRYTGIYANWNVDVDNADTDNDVTTGTDDPWDFGAAFQYPVLKYGGQDIYRQGRVLPAEPAEPEAPAEAPPIIYNLNIRFDARRIALPEGHQATYRVRLAGQPAGRGSNIRIRSDNPDVQPTPDALRFTAANWNQWQTVAISIAGDPNHTDENATLAHYGPNRGYGSVLVSVTDTGDSRQAGDTTPPALTVVTEPGARWGVTVTPTVPADLAADGEVRVSSAYRVPRTATGYSLGRSGAAQAIVSIAAPDDTPASGLTVCLPVARALADEAGERPLTLLRYTAAADDGASWQPVSGAEHNAATRSVCAAGVTGFGPFAAAYALPQ